jgi:arylsulfatase
LIFARAQGTLPSMKNIMMILADQHHAGVMGCAGHPQALTPNLDQLASEGVRFTNAYTQNPICTPSRVSILSGQYCHNHGLYGLSGPVPGGLNNLFRHCRAAGYRTAGVGKMHLPNRPRNWVADDVDLFADTYETPDGEIGTSAYLDHLEAAGLHELQDSWHNTRNYGKGAISLDARPSMLPYENTQEVWSAGQAMSFIDADPGRPFCVQVSFQKPHHPLLPNPRFWDLYPEDLELPSTFDIQPDHRPPHFRQQWEGLRRLEWDYGSPGETYRDGARRAWRGTLACVSQIDDVTGMLLRFLDERGLADDTIVVYGSDHGCYHTIHGIAEKAPGICSDAVCRVPMIMRAPGAAEGGRACDALVENIDMVPTLLSLCGLPPMDTVDGIDLGPVLTGEAEEVREAAVTENPWSKSIRWKNWRLVHYQPEMFPGQDTGELYNMADDPDELKNLYVDPASHNIVERGRRLLLEWLIRTTRITTSNPAVRNRLSGSGAVGTFSFPTASDGRGPNAVQPRYREDNFINYL